MATGTKGQSGGASSRPKLTRSVPNGDAVDPAVVEIAWSVNFTISVTVLQFLGALMISEGMDTVDWYT